MFDQVLYRPIQEGFGFKMLQKFGWKAWVLPGFVGQLWAFTIMTIITISIISTQAQRFSDPVSELVTSKIGMQNQDISRGQIQRRGLTGLNP